MMDPSHWPSHWGFVLASYGLVIVVLAVTIISSLLRLRHATRRLALMQRIQGKTANESE